MTLKNVLFWGGLGVAAIACGIGWTAYTVKRPDDVAVSAGPWKANLLAGSANADLVTRARVATGGLLALGRDETLYYVARTDSSGRDLRSRCEYRIEGVKPDARWWSITAYADDYFLFADAQQRFSINSMTVKPDAQGRFAAISAPGAKAADGSIAHIQTSGDRGLIFTLRLYNPAESLQENPALLDPPRIEPLGACS